MHALVLAWLSAATALADGAPDAGYLEDVGLQRKGRVLVLDQEIDFNRRMSRLRSLRTRMIEALRKQEAFNRREQDGWTRKEQLINERQALSGQLATTRTVRQHNKLVARINQITDQLALVDMAAQNPERLATDAAVRSARGDYTAEVESLRTLADEVRARYAELAADPRVEAALATLNVEARRPLSLGPRRKFDQDVARLESFVQGVERTAIQMTSRMNSHWVEVEFNGKFTHDMIFDTGADFVCLTSAMAARMGIVPDDNAPIFLVGMASGGMVETRAVFLPSISVGGFEVHDVTCVIWPPEMTTAPPLLGGSFLRHFIYEIDPAADTLTLTRITPGH